MVMKAKCSTANKKDTTKKRLGVLIFLKKTLTLVSRIVKALYAPFTKFKYSRYQKKNRTGNKNTSLYRGKVKNIREQKCRLLEWGPLGGWEGPLTIDIILDYSTH